MRTSMPTLQLRMRRNGRVRSYARAGLARCPGALQADAPDAEFGQCPVVRRGAEAPVGDHGCRRPAGQRGHPLDRGHQLWCVGRVPALDLVVDDEAAFLLSHQ